MPRFSSLALVAFALGGIVACAASRHDAQNSAAASGGAKADAQAFLDLYNSLYQHQSAVAAEAEWAASTDVSPENEAKRTAANQVLAAFKGDKEVIEQARGHLKRKAELDPLQVRQLDSILLRAGGYPGTIPDVVNARVEWESKQAALQDGFTFCMEKVGADGKCGKPVSANQIDAALKTNKKLDERLAWWTASKEIGRPLKPGLVELQKLRNQVAREMGHSSFFALQVADYGMTVDEMMTLLDSFNADNRALYDELQWWVTKELAKRYGVKAPKRGAPVPAHWFSNRWAQNWPGIAEGVDLDPYFKGKSAEWIVKQGESFYTSIGMKPLPKTFWTKSDLYPVKAGGERKKNSHASAWHLDLDQDVRSLMSVEPDSRWFETTHHELGHIYYFLAYSNPKVPPTLREGANRAFHEGLGDLIGIAAGQEPYLRQHKILPETVKWDADRMLLQEGLDHIAFVPWSAGVMSRFEYELYEKNLPPDQWQTRWWEIKNQYQNVAVPSKDRLTDPSLCDACTKTHINDDPAQYYDYALANVIKYQLHEHIAKKILEQDVHACNYYGNKEVGAFLQEILEKGQTEDWRKVIRDATGEDISTRAMREYFEPLRTWLEKENRD